MARGNAVDVSLLLATGEISRGKEGRLFVDSVTAKEFVESMDYLGLKIDERLNNALTEGVLGYGGFSDRYGNGYAELTRYIVYDLFEKDGGIFKGVGREKLTKLIERGISGPNRLIFSMVYDKLFGDPKRDGENEYPLWRNSTLSKRGDGGCKDAEVYLHEEIKRDEVKYLEDFVLFYGGRGGVKSGSENVRDGYFLAMTTRDIVVEGVIIPKGFLCRLSEKGRVELLRASIGCFNEEEAKDAFGSQYGEVKESIDVWNR